MLKLGITKIEQLLSKDNTDTRIIAVSLLTDLSHAKIDAEEVDHLRRDIIRSIILPNTTGKITWENRFSEIDEAVAAMLKQNFPQALECLDIGVSDGTTAVDLFARLRDIPGLSYVASDINECLYVRKGKLWTDVCDDAGLLIQVSIGPFAVPITSLRHMHPLQIVNRCIYFWNCHVGRKKVYEMWSQDIERKADQRSFAKVVLKSAAYENEPKRINAFGS